MASPSPRANQSVNLAAPATRGSRIRRDPPPVVKEVTAADIRERDYRYTAIGVTAFALALFAVLLGVASVTGRPAKPYGFELRYGD